MNIYPALMALAVFAPGDKDSSNFFTVPIPNSPVSGKLSGSEFVVTEAVMEADGKSAIQVGNMPPDSVRPYKLKLMDRSEGRTRCTLYVRIQVDWDRRLDGSKFVSKPFAEDSPEDRKQKETDSKNPRFARGITKVEVYAYPQNGGTAGAATFRDKISARIEFGKLKDGYLPGKIMIGLPDSSKSLVAGTFRAAYKVRHGDF